MSDPGGGVPGAPRTDPLARPVRNAVRSMCPLPTTRPSRQNFQLIWTAAATASPVAAAATFTVHFQHVAESAQRTDQYAGRLESRAQAMHVNRNSRVGQRLASARHASRKGGYADHPPGITREDLQQSELLTRQIRRTTVDHDPGVTWRHHQAPDANRLRARGQSGRVSSRGNDESLSYEDGLARRRVRSFVRSLQP